MPNATVPNLYTLTVVDLSGIQDYVFGSNRLAENVGASALVEQATHQWPLKLVEKMARGRSNVRLQTGQGGEAEAILDPALQIERDGLLAEVIYTGGGNAVILFDAPPDEPLRLAREFAARYSKQLLTDAPGLESALVHQAVAWNQRGAAQPPNLRDALRLAWQNLAVRKATRLRSTPLLGLGVSAACQATGLPAAGYPPAAAKRSQTDRHFRVLSTEVLAKLEDALRDWSAARLRRMIPDLASWRLWYDLDASDPELASHGQGAYVAVVHADGNSMGQRFLQLTQRAADDRAAVAALRSLSTLVNESGRLALADCGTALAEAWDEKLQTLAQSISLPKGEIMPFRPLVYGGDDITFVCEGRLGLELAAHFLRCFETRAKQQLAQSPTLGALLPEKLHAMTACAGVAIVKAHYPFARAYALSEALAANAKAHVREQMDDGKGRAFSALDWHLAAGPLYGSIGQLRDADYTLLRQIDENTLRKDHLEMRPVRLHEKDDDWRSWEQFRYIVRTFQENAYWRRRRSKVQGLDAPLAAGETALQQYRHAFALPVLPSLPSFASKYPNLVESGWDGERCGYYDAVEALDYLAPLTRPGAAEDRYDP